MTHIVRKLVVVALLTAIARPASAARCNLTTTAVAFGAYDPFGGPRDATGAVRIDCNGTSSAQVQLGPGTSGDAADRRMSSGTDTLRYNVYGDAARTQVFTWVTTGGGVQSIPLYGRIFAGQPVAPGSYGDTLTITVVF